MALALNNLQRVDMPLNKERKRNRPRRGCPRGVMVKAMDYEIVVRSNSSRAITFTFGQILLGKV